MRDIIQKKRKRELLEKFELIYQKVCPKLDNVFRGVSFYHNSDDSLKKSWNKMNNEKMIGVLHAFVLLKPTISKAINNSQRLDESMRFMHTHGFPTHHLADKKGLGANPYTTLPADSIPVLTRDDSSKFLEMEFKSAQVGDKMRLVFQTLKKAMDTIGENMP